LVQGPTFFIKLDRIVNTTILHQNAKKIGSLGPTFIIKLDIIANTII